MILVVISGALLIWALRTLKTVPDLPATISGPLGAITAARAKEYSASLREFIILIDGVAVGRLGPGQIKHFPVKAGPHTVATKIDWCTSAPFEVEKRPNENLVLRCGVRSNFAAFYRPQTYAYVRNDG